VSVEQHFVCAKCEKPFLGTRHYEKKGLAYCETHYHQASCRTLGRVMINLTVPSSNHPEMTVPSSNHPETGDYYYS
jgi:LIM domain